jgi:cation diffusion facilitator CzcD-associated flavoprotein CzcO
MQTWKRMHGGMGLKSPDFGTNIYTPRPGYTFIEYSESRGFSATEPIEIARFAQYGLWAQQHLVPQVEDVPVLHLRQSPDGFELALGTNERLHARRVVVAVGLTYFARMPEEFVAVPRELASHTSHHTDLSRFRSQEVAVLGAGQSALEAAALLHENGARAQLLVRGSGAYFADPPSPSRSLYHRLTYPKTVLGPGRLNWVLQHFPTAVHYLPERRRVALTRKHLGPWGAWWLKHRVVGKVPVQPRCRVVKATPTDSRLSLRVRDADGSERDLTVDHVVCGTGYEADVDRIPFLDRELVARIRRVVRAPALSRNFESSVRGLYFVGQASSFSFGPLVRFVAGAAYAAPTLARRFARELRSQRVASAIPAFSEARPLPEDNPKSA